MELLAPAGNYEAFIAAIACGADAVYLGYTSFGARSYASNFDEKTLPRAIEYAHERGRKIYVTVNTLIKEKEIPELRKVLGFLESIHPDAVLVQDMGVARLILESFPGLSLHASTQMTIHNTQGASYLKALGFSRVVPSRECSLDEIRSIVNTGIEVEVFAHGALCVAVSGQCLFSSMVGGRSGNRGRCAQPCRMEYSFSGVASVKDGYLLSTRDLMLIDSLPSLAKAGVASIKLEGRMKRPEYVAAVTSAYRQALDSIDKGIEYRADASVREALKQVFNRGGFTQGHLMGQNHAALMSPVYSGHQGVQIGEIRASRGRRADVLLAEDLDDGDQLQVRNGAQEYQIVYHGPKTESGQTASIMLPTGCNPYKGTRVFRLVSFQQMNSLNKRVHELQAKPFIETDAYVRTVPGEKARLELSDSEGNRAVSQGELLVLPAASKPLTEESVKTQIAKMGGTPYHLRSLRWEGQNAFLPVNELNKMRRDALRQLREKRLAYSSNAVVREPYSHGDDHVLPCKDTVYACSSEPGHAKALIDAGADVYIWRIGSLILKDLQDKLASCTAERIVMELPALVFSDEMRQLLRFTEENRDRICAVMLNSTGQIGVQWPCEKWGGQGLNVMNSECARFYEEAGVQRMNASCELNISELQQLFDRGGNYMIQAYGRTQLMLLSHCPVCTAAGEVSSNDHCKRCDASGGKSGELVDNRRYRFPLYRIRRAEGCLLRLYNSVTTDMHKYGERIRKLSCGVRLDFWEEPLPRQLEIVSSYRSLMDGNGILHTATDGITSGHLLRGIE